MRAGVSSGGFSGGRRITRAELPFACRTGYRAPGPAVPSRPPVVGRRAARLPVRRTLACLLSQPRPPAQTLRGLALVRAPTRHVGGPTAPLARKLLLRDEVNGR